MPKIERREVDDSSFEVKVDGVYEFWMSRSLVSPFLWELRRVEADRIQPALVDQDRYSNDLVERIECGNYTSVSICMLLEGKHTPVPEAVEVVQSFGTERIVDTETGLPIVTGTAMYVKASVAAFRKWLKPLGPVWTSTNPMIGGWTLDEFGEKK